MVQTTSLQSAIYHERQEPGSMLCAQHALNSLLQDNYFTATDLSALATSLDQLEDVYNPEHAGQPSTNQDDTGFFSLQVMENALDAFGLNLVRWRSEVMRPYHNEPHNQRAFILNLDQHWFTLRRFGDEWYNLNSILPTPSPIGKLYLGMVLQQSEEEGYSVFVVLPSDPSNPQPFPRCAADELAFALQQPSSIDAPATPAPAAPVPGDEPNWRDEDEDMDLQAALQASLSTPPSYEPGPPDIPTPTRTTSAPPPAPGASTAAPSTEDRFGNFSRLGGAAPGPAGFGSGSASRGEADDLVADLEDIDEDGTEEYYRARLRAVRARADYLRDRAGMPSAHGDLDDGSDEDEDPATAADPVAASMARTQRMLSQMQRQQEAAFALGGGGTGEHERRRRQEEEEALQRAIEESRLMYESSNARNPDDNAAAVAPPPPQTEADAWDAAERQLREEQLREHHRVYDDEDEELQAALRASLETVPPGLTPSEDPATTSSVPAPPGPVSAPVAGVTAPGPSQPAPLKRNESETSDAYETESEAGTEDDAPAEPVDQAAVLAEMRRKRLERFGQ